MPDLWHFPLPRTHTGLLQGNGTMGVMIWGSDRTLCLTLNRGDFWDHRGGKSWTPAMNYARIRSLLEAGDEAGLRTIFGPPPATPDAPGRPTLLPMGRLELHWPAGCVLRRGELETSTGQVGVVLTDAQGQEHRVVLDLAMDQPVLHVGLPAGLAPPALVEVSAWEHVAEALAARGLPRPVPLSQWLSQDSQDASPGKDAIHGWVQPTVSDRAMGLGYRQTGHSLWIALALTAGPLVPSPPHDATDATGSGQPGEGRASLMPLRSMLDYAMAQGAPALQTRAQAWWADYWATVPKVSLPHAGLAFLYRYGMYKFAGLTNPLGVPAGLQGPWIEEYQLPPWSSDYHFNINVQMCYSPAYRGNRLAHLRPLFDMVGSWHESLRENARLFVGIDDGLMLPHAVDDRGRIVGGFWSGTIDHGCTAWVGKMMFDAWSYDGRRDAAFLRDRVHPFLVGAMRVYEAMLERTPEGEYRLPVSVSPEYRGNAMNAWGANASFQLACIHWLIESLTEAREALGLPMEQGWRDIQDHLPRACVEGGQAGFSWWETSNRTQQRPGQPAPSGGRTDAQIALWEGVTLEESHRHHSHLAGLVPFDVLDMADMRLAPVLENTLRTWVFRGMGAWSGWCMPWAVMLHSRMNNGDAAVTLLELWQKLFTNEGHGTLHDVQFPGLSLIGAGPRRAKSKAAEIMQMDAGMGVTSAILDMLLHDRRGVHHLFAGCPAGWREVAFEGIRCAGGFLVSATRQDHRVTHVAVQSEAGGRFHLMDPWTGNVTTMDLTPGQTMTLQPPAEPSPDRSIPSA